MNIRLLPCRYIRDFSALYGTFLLALAFFLAVRIYGLRLQGSGETAQSMWDARAYFGLWVTQRVTLACFYMAATAASIYVLQEKFFNIEALVINA